MSCMQFDALSFIIFLVLLIVSCRSQNAIKPSFCSLEEQSVESYLQEGDLVLGFLLDIFFSQNVRQEIFTQKPTKANTSFNIMSFAYYINLLAAIFAIDEVNKNPNILPNRTLGFHFFDSWKNERKAVANILSMFTRGENAVPNYMCYKKGALMAIVGHISSSISYIISQFAQIYKFPQISHGAQDPIFNDRQKFPEFYRTMVSEKNQYEAIIYLLKTFKWNWVGIVASKEESYKRAGEGLKNAIVKQGICVEFFILVTDKDPKTFALFAGTLTHSTSHVIIIYTQMVLFFHITMVLKSYPLKRILWLSCLDSHTINLKESTLCQDVINGSIILDVHNQEIPGFNTFFLKASPLQFPNDTFTAAVWYIVFYCSTSQEFVNSKGSLYSLCNENHTIEFYGSSIFHINAFRKPYNIYIAVYVIAYALHNMFSEKSRHVKNIMISKAAANTHLQLNHFLRNVHFTTPTGYEIYFDEDGGVPGHYSILNWNYFSNGTITTRQIGVFDPSMPLGKQFVINKEDILWPPHFNGIPCSTCSKSCPPGFRKLLKEGMQVCCYDCIKCAEGEISTLPDMDNCVKCPEDQWSNKDRNKCIMKTIEFLSFEDPLGIALTSTTVFLSVYTLATLCLFMKHHNSTIVKANNRELSYTILISITMSLLGSLLFIGRPRKVTCLLRQAAFGVNFSICISSVLGKTMTVIIAFNATKPGSKLRKWVGNRIPRLIVLFCSLIELVICTCWLIISPPFPDYDKNSQTSSIILHCNEGSDIALFCIVGYIASLAFISFFAAYLVRNLPDIYNEAQHITFSMLVFCSVWITFFPTYLSTKGKNVAAVEIFAILASSLGLLSFIFIPKCYTILTIPEINSKSQAMCLKSKQIK